MSQEIAAAPAQPETPAQTPAPAPEPVASTPAAEQPITLDDLKVGSKEYDHWNRTGELPTREAKPEAEPEPVDPIIARIVKTPPPPGVSKRQHERNEILRFAAEQEQRALAAEKRFTAPPTANQPPAQPATPPQPAKEYDGIDPRDPEPSIDQFADAPDPYAAHLRAQIKWEDRKDARISQHKQQQTAQQTEFATRRDAWVGRRDTFAATNQDFAIKAGPLLEQLRADTPIGDTIMDSPIGPQLALHLAEHRAEFQRISGLHWRAQLLELGKLEASLSTPPAASAQPAAPQPKTVSSAPPPPPTLGTRSAEPADGVAAAVARNDFSAYEREANARDLARVGRR